MIGRLLVLLVLVSMLLGLAVFALTHVGLALLCCGGTAGYALWRRRSGG